MATKQYPKAKEMQLLDRLKLVSKFHSMGFGATRIARELEYSESQAKRDIAAVVDRTREFDDLDEYLRNTTARIGEQIEKLNEQEATLWKQLDWARAWVVQTDSFGAPVYEYDENGDRNPQPLHGPRRPGIVPQLVGQIQGVNKQQAELLGLLHKQVDISMKLQLTERVQVTILESIKECDKDVYTRIVRQIQAAKATLDMPALPGSGTGRTLDDVIDARFIER